MPILKAITPCFLDIILALFHLVAMPPAASIWTVSQSLATGSRQDLQLGGETTASYGYLFNIRTKPNSSVIMLTGLDFYTESMDEVNFELWSRPGNFKGYKG